MTEYASPKRPERREEFQRLPASPFAPHFIEKLLLAIIEANPRPAEDYKHKKAETLSATRLNRAMNALFGMLINRQTVNDMPTLVRGAQHNVWDESCRQYEIKMDGKTPKQTSVALSQILGYDSDTQTESSGRKEYARLLERSKKPDVFEYLYWVTNHVEHAEEKAMLADIQTIAVILKKWNIDTEIDPDKLGLHSMSQFWPDD